MNIQLFHHKAREPSLFYSVGAKAWDECSELQEVPKEEWLVKSLKIVESYDRVEVLAHEDGVSAGGCILVVDEYDPHVQVCGCIAYCYVEPSYRGKGVAKLLMQEALKFTSDKGLTILKYSRRLKPYRYEIIYKKV